jgi:hypothetical protein
MINGYVTPAEIVDFMRLINPEFEETDINDILVNSTFHTVNSIVDVEFEETTENRIVSGTKDDFFFSDIVPILNVTKVVSISPNGVENEFTISGDGRNLFWDRQTGFFQIYNKTIPVYDLPQSIRIEGTFGTIATDLVKQIQLLMILKQYSIVQPDVYKTDIISEKIGRYEYKLANASNVAPENQRKGLDGMINFLIDQLPQINRLTIESV